MLPPTNRLPSISPLPEISNVTASNSPVSVKLSCDVIAPTLHMVSIIAPEAGAVSNVNVVPEVT